MATLPGEKSSLSLEVRKKTTSSSVNEDKTLNKSTIYKRSDNGIIVKRDGSYYRVQVYQGKKQLSFQNNDKDFIEKTNAIALGIVEGLAKDNNDKSYLPEKIGSKTILDLTKGTVKLENGQNKKEKIVDNDGYFKNLMANLPDPTDTMKKISYKIIDLINMCFEYLSGKNEEKKTPLKPKNDVTETTKNPSSSDATKTQSSSTSTSSSSSSSSSSVEAAQDSKIEDIKGKPDKTVEAEKNQWTHGKWLELKRSVGEPCMTSAYHFLQQAEQGKEITQKILDETLQKGIIDYLEIKDKDSDNGALLTMPALKTYIFSSTSDKFIQYSFKDILKPSLEDNNGTFSITDLQDGSCIDQLKAELKEKKALFGRFFITAKGYTYGLILSLNENQEIEKIGLFDPHGKGKRVDDNPAYYLEFTNNPVENFKLFMEDFDHFKSLGEDVDLQTQAEENKKALIQIEAKNLYNPVKNKLLELNHNKKELYEIEQMENSEEKQERKVLFESRLDSEADEIAKEQAKQIIEKQLKSNSSDSVDEMQTQKIIDELVEIVHFYDGLEPTTSSSESSSEDE